MSLPIFRRIWITLVNLMCIGLISVSFLQNYEFSSILGATRPSSSDFGRVGPLLCATFLLLGILLEWRDRTRLALIVNAGFFAVFGFAVLGKAALMVMTKSPAQYHPEASLAVAIVGIPFAIIALADFLLYWSTRPVGSGHASRIGHE